MTKHDFHNALRLLLNIEGSQLDFLTSVQQDNFFANPHMFFIRADDATADKLWDLMYPKPPQARDGVVVKFPGRWSPEVRVGGIEVKTAKVGGAKGASGQWSPGYYDA